LVTVPEPETTPLRVPSTAWFKTSALLSVTFPGRVAVLATRVPALMVVPPE